MGPALNSSTPIASFCPCRCFCDSVANDTVASGTPFTPEALMLYLNQSVSATDPNAPFSYTLTQYKNDPYYCACESASAYDMQRCVLGC